MTTVCFSTFLFSFNGQTNRIEMSLKCHSPSKRSCLGFSANFCNMLSISILIVHSLIQLAFAHFAWSKSFLLLMICCCEERGILFLCLIRWLGQPEGYLKFENVFCYQTTHVDLTKQFSSFITAKPWLPAWRFQWPELCELPCFLRQHNGALNISSNQRIPLFVLLD